MRKGRSTPLTAALVLVLAADASGQGAVEFTPSGDPAPLPAVRLLEPREAEAARARTFFGRVAARETVALSFEIGGRLVEIPVREGAAVDAGQTVARLDPDPLVRAVERAELQLDQAERDFARARKLAASNVASEVRAEDAETARDLADVALRDAREALRDAVLEAPFDGLVAERVAVTFANVSPGEPILRLHDMSEVRVEIEMPERVLARTGDPSDIVFSGERPDGASTPLALVEFEAQTGQVGQSFRMALAIPPEAARGLIPGASMTVTASLPVSGGGRTLPAGAILGTTDGGFAVMVFHSEDGGGGRVERREVVVGAPTGTTFEVEGIAGDERVVAAGGHLLKDGQRVRVYEGLTVEER